MNKCLVYFKLTGNFDPNEVTEAVSLNPTSALARGSINSINVIPKTSIWEYALDQIEADNIDIYELCSELISILTVSQDKFKIIRQKLKLKAVLQIVLWIDCCDTVSLPPFGIKEEVVMFLAYVGATIDVDLYKYS